MSNITEDQALEFAEAMAEESPPTNQNLINQHIDWWQQEYPQFAPVVRDWYEYWQDYLNDEVDDYIQYNEAYHDFLDLLEDLPYEIDS